MRLEKEIGKKKKKKGKEIGKVGGFIYMFQNLATSKGVSPPLKEESFCSFSYHFSNNKDNLL